MNEIAFLIRFCYGDDYPEEGRRWRFDWFKSAVLPRILAQTYFGFDLWLWVNPKHEDEVRAMHPRINTFTLATPMVRPDTPYPWRTTRGLPRYPIQVRMDSDDLIAPTFLRRAVDELALTKARRAIVHFQPYKVDVTTGQVRWCAPNWGRGQYDRRHVSAFLAYRQKPDAADYSWVYSHGHINLWQIAEDVRMIEEGYCWAACHGFNDSTAMYPYDRVIGDFPEPLVPPLLHTPFRETNDPGPVIA